MQFRQSDEPSAALDLSPFVNKLNTSEEWVGVYKGGGGGERDKMHTKRELELSIKKGNESFLISGAMNIYGLR